LKNSLFIIISAFISIFSDISEATDIQKKNEYVIFLHGIGRSRRSMRFIEKYIADRGYRTYNLNYPSTKKTIQEIVLKYIPSVIEKCKGADKIHFVVHSMGGIIMRHYLQDHSLPKGSRIVMLAAPNHGSEVTDFFRNFFLYKWIYGPAGQQLGTEAESLPNILKPVVGSSLRLEPTSLRPDVGSNLRLEPTSLRPDVGSSLRLEPTSLRLEPTIGIGVITGNTSWDPLSYLIPGQSDGKVSVESAKLKEMKDFLVVPFGHTFIMNHSIVMKQTLYFIEHGKFEKP